MHKTGNEMYCHGLEVMSLNPGWVELCVRVITCIVWIILTQHASALALRLKVTDERVVTASVSVTCHYLEVMSSNSGRVELEVCSTSVLNCT